MYRFFSLFITPKKLIAHLKQFQKSRQMLYYFLMCHLPQKFPLSMFFIIILLLIAKKPFLFRSDNCFRLKNAFEAKSEKLVVRWSWSSSWRLLLLSCFRNRTTATLSLSLSLSLSLTHTHTHKDTYTHSFFFSFFVFSAFLLFESF